MNINTLLLLIMGTMAALKNKDPYYFLTANLIESVCIVYSL